MLPRPEDDSVEEKLLDAERVGSKVMTTSRKSKISQFQNMLGFIQYGSLLFGIDASSGSAKFQDDRLSKSRLNMKFQNQKLAKNGEFDK